MLQEKEQYPTSLQFLYSNILGEKLKGMGNNQTFICYLLPPTYLLSLQRRFTFDISSFLDPKPAWGKKKSKTRNRSIFRISFVFAVYLQFMCSIWPIFRPEMAQNMKKSGYGVKIELVMKVNTLMGPDVLVLLKDVIG